MNFVVTCINRKLVQLLPLLAASQILEQLALFDVYRRSTLCIVSICVLLFVDSHLLDLCRSDLYGILKNCIH